MEVTSASSCASGFADGATDDRTAWVQGSLRGPYSDELLGCRRRRSFLPVLAPRGRCEVIGEV